MNDPGIWVCLDEGCNSNCHGKEWAANAVAKLEKCMIKQKFDWVHQRERTFTGIGGIKVKTYGKRKLPVAMKLNGSQQILPGFLE
eukprot:7707738-Karenia_brevis.AAC.1